MIHFSEDRVVAVHEDEALFLRDTVRTLRAMFADVHVTAEEVRACVDGLLALKPLLVAHQLTTPCRASPRRPGEPFCVSVNVQLLDAFRLFLKRRVVPGRQAPPDPEGAGPLARPKIWDALATYVQVNPVDRVAGRVAGD
jgi:hypothetical protein